MEPLVTKLFNRNPDISEFLTPLHIGSAPDLHMEHFRIGIDNLHIDVVLSQKFQSALSHLVQKMVHEELARLGFSFTGKLPGKSEFDHFRDTYRGLWEGVLNCTSEKPSVADHAKLLQLAMLKVMLETPRSVIRDLRRQLQKDVDLPSSDRRGRMLEIHDRLVALARHEPGIRYRTLRRLFKLAQQLESKEIRKVRKSILGVSWVLPKTLLYNPLLNLPDVDRDAYFSNHYPIMFMDPEHEGHFTKTNQIFCEQFADYIADWCQPANLNTSDPEDSAAVRIQAREWRGGFTDFFDAQRTLEKAMREEEFEQCRNSWLDWPNNIDRICQKTPTSSWFAGLGNMSRIGNVTKRSEVWLDFQQRVTHELYKRLYKDGLLQRAIASYRTPRLYRQLHEKLAVRDIYDYLAGSLPRRKLVKQLGSASAAESEGALRALDSVFHYIQHIPANKQLEYTSRYLKDFLTFRRDLKLAHFAYRRMSRLRLLRDSEEISLSRDNGSLYEFRLRSEVDPSQGKIRAHVVLKADIRGSTEITHQLMQMRLNPATHFSLNFFGPITKLLERFCAQKVFVEGDALILSVLETDAVDGQSMIVAYACGLACKILTVMESQNRQNQYNKLPQLELGLGIAFSDDAPAYLYDDRRKIMISPAINQADRLSSCSAELRRSTTWKRSKRHCVEVMYGGHGKTQKDQLLRYNVNGILLDPPAFERLKKELVMHQVCLQSRSGANHYYHAGRFVDHQGASHWLAVREASIKVMTDDHKVVDAQDQADHFYEVISDSELMERIKDKLHTRRRDYRLTSSNIGT